MIITPEFFVRFSFKIQPPAYLGDISLFTAQIPDSLTIARKNS